MKVSIEDADDGVPSRPPREPAALHLAHEAAEGVPLDTPLDAPPDHPIGFFDDRMTRWFVAERDSRRDPGARGDRCLVFSSIAAVRRVWRYPADWGTLSAEALAALSWQR